MNLKKIGNPNTEQTLTWQNLNVYFDTNTNGIKTILNNRKLQLRKKMLTNAKR
jgi:hypothetical protein